MYRTQRRYLSQFGMTYIRFRVFSKLDGMDRFSTKESAVSRTSLYSSAGKGKIMTRLFTLKKVDAYALPQYVVHAPMTRLRTTQRIDVPSPMMADC